MVLPGDERPQAQEVRPLEMKPSLNSSESFFSGNKAKWFGAPPVDLRDLFWSNVKFMDELSSHMLGGNDEVIC